MEKNATYQIFVNGLALKKRLGNRKAAGTRFDKIRDAAIEAKKPISLELVSTSAKGRLVLRKFHGGAN